MGTLADALAKVGLMSDEVIARQKHREKSMMGEQFHHLTKKTGHEATLARLATCSSVSEFKDTARKLLTTQPDLIEEVITQAHRLRDEKGGKKLVWLVFQVRDGLKDTKPEDRERFLRRAFRKSGTTLDLIE